MKCLNIWGYGYGGDGWEGMSEVGGVCRLDGWGG